jgi:hypothetical protein
MARVDNLDNGEFARLKKRLSALENATPLANSSVERGQLRMYSGSSLLIQDGNLSVTGTATIAGLLNGSGTVTWTGPSNWNGPVNIGGTCTITGNTTLNANLTLGTGSIKAGPITIDNQGAYAGRIASSSSLLLDVTGSTVVTSPLTVEGKITAINDLDVGGNLKVTGNQTVLGSKSFLMDHPVKPGWNIQHGSTESPVSGTEYWGRDTFDDSGECVVELPDYFEALNKERNRATMVFAVGRPFLVGSEDIVDGRFVAYGEPGREFRWLVKAERFGGDFETEWPKAA